MPQPYDRRRMTNQLLPSPLLSLQPFASVAVVEIVGVTLRAGVQVRADPVCHEAAHLPTQLSTGCQ